MSVDLDILLKIMLKNIKAFCDQCFCKDNRAFDTRCKLYKFKDGQAEGPSKEEIYDKVLKAIKEFCSSSCSSKSKNGCNEKKCPLRYYIYMGKDNDVMFMSDRNKFNTMLTD